MICIGDLLDGHNDNYLIMKKYILLEDTGIAQSTNV